MSNLTVNEKKEYTKLAAEMRENILKMIFNAKSGHIGGAFSTVEIFIVLFRKIMKHFPDWNKNPDFSKRDRFILSKGHASASLYSILAEEGYFKKEELMTFRKLGSRLQGHPSYGLLPGVEVSTGSLGQGLSIACGAALGLKLDKIDSYVYVYMGDGEIQEGQIWEAAMSASHHKLDNLIGFVDKNCYQIDGSTCDVKTVDPIDKKFEAFGWNSITIDGHNFDEIYDSILKAKELNKKTGKPTVIVAKTVKGKGVSFMENTSAWHGKAPGQEDFERAIKELKGECDVD